MRGFLTVILSSGLALTALAANAADDSLNCVLLPDQQVDVSSPVPGVIQEVLVERAQHVSGGQVIARMESTVEAATVVLARARASTDAELRLRRVEHEYDAQHRDRLHTLQARNATSSQSLDDASRVTEAARLRVQLAEDRRREALLERQRADALLALKTIRSPIEGVVVQRHKTVGEYVEAHPILSVARLDPLRVEVITPLAMFGTVHEGMLMAIRAETDPDNERIATVTAVDAVADPGSGTFGIQLELPNPDLKLPAGIKCNGRLLSEAEVAALAPAPQPAPALQSTVQAPASAVAPASGISHVTADESQAEACLVYDAVASESQALALVAAARQLGAAANLQEVSETRAVGYVVVTRPIAMPEERSALAASLRKAGVTDLLIFTRGDFSDRISVGAYTGPLSAERRRVELAGLGFKMQVQPRTRSFHDWRVHIALPEAVDTSQARSALAQVSGSHQGEVGACQVPRTAAR